MLLRVVLIPRRVLSAALATLVALSLDASGQQTAGTDLRPARVLPLCASAPTCPWPAEPPSSAINLTSIEGPGTNDFHVDMSGAFWNPYESALWVCRNGGTGGSKVWKLVQTSMSAFQVGTVQGQRAEWTSFGDCEALALASFAEPSTIFTVDEATSSVKEWSLSTPTAVLSRTWNLAAFVPAYTGGLGIEALAFVPDAVLSASGFVGANGLPRTSTQGMGALTFVGHQNGGHVYVFDLNRTNGAVQFVGKYATGDSETAELSFDPSFGVMYAWHGDGENDLEVFKLASVPAGAHRRFKSMLTYDYPSTANDEGFAVQWSPYGCNGTRGAFVLTDGGGASSLRWFKSFRCGF